MTESYNFNRFLEAQQGVYDSVLRELESGAKTGHWIWYIFPQISGLGNSELSKHFSISSIDEAIAYLEQPILGARLRQCTKLVTEVNGKSIQEIFGYPDCLKFCSCMTLFSQATQDKHVFEEALEKYFGGKPDVLTLQVLGEK